ncbi:20917_t:CDS:2 [Rhizophagus irregularis]|nr:20917_t:CDS:2 [Rhizophagus irregularis]
MQTNNEDDTSSVANNVMPAILKRLETLERLQTANHNKATNSHGFDVDSDDTSDNSSKKRIYQFLSKIYYMFVNIQFIIQK